MSLFLIVTGDFVKTGGMDRANHALASFLSSQGHEVHLVAFRVDTELLAMPGIVWHRVPKPAGSYTLALPLLDHYGRRWARKIAARGGRVIVNGGSCHFGDVNWVHFIHAAHRPDVRRGIVRRAATLFNQWKWQRDECRALQFAKLLITNSNHTGDELVEHYGVSRDRIHTVYCGCDSDALRPPTSQEKIEIRARLGWSKDRPVVAFVGAMSDRRKGFDTLYDAWKQLCRLPEWDANLVVIGAGSEVPAWGNRTRTDGVADRVRFLGLRNDVPQLLQACDAFVAPARYEPYGLTVHEALCCGLPAFVSAVSGVAERYPAELQDLLLRDPNNASELVTRLRDWRGGTGKYFNAIVPLSNELRQHSWRNMAEQMLCLIEQSSGEARAASAKKSTDISDGHESRPPMAAARV